MNCHNLKSWPSSFAAVVAGDKRAEFRRDDRGFAVGDVLRLMEWLPADEQFTGKTQLCEITHVQPGGAFGVPEGFAILSLVLLVRPAARVVPFNPEPVEPPAFHNPRVAPVAGCKCATCRLKTATAALSENPLPAEPPQPRENTPAEPPAPDLSANDRLQTASTDDDDGGAPMTIEQIFGPLPPALEPPFFHRDPSGCPIPPAPPGCSCGQTMAITQIEEFALEGGGTAVDFLWECLSCKANTGVRIPGGVRAAASFGRRWLNRSEQFT